MNTSAKLGLAAAAIMIVAVVGYSMLPRTNLGPGGVPTPSPSAVPTAAPSPTATAVSCEDGTTGCLGKLPGGTYTTTNFQPKLTYTVPAGPASGPPAAYWTNIYDLSTAFGLAPAGGGGYTFQIFSHVAIPDQTSAECKPVAKPGVGNAVADWVQFLTNHPGLVTTASDPVTVGGSQGVRVDFARADSWTALCPGSVGPAVVTILRGADTQRPGVQWTDNQQESFWVLDVAGETVLVIVESGPGAQHAADVANAQPIIDSFVFRP